MNRFKKRLFANALAMLLLVSIIPAAAAYSDIADAETLKAANLLSSLGIVSPAEKFNPGNTLTRAMFCVMAVSASGVSDIEVYKSFTLFTDVRASHWSLGYVNAAVRLKLMTPRSDGSFGPDDPITYNEAVTILVKMLGYTEQDVGYNWPRSFLNKAKSIGLTNGVEATDTLTRAQGARLFYNLLYTPVKAQEGGAGADFIESVFGVQHIENVIITEVNVYSGGKPGIVTADGKFYPTRAEVDASLVDRRADIMLDNKGFALSIAPQEQTFSTIGVYSAREGYVISDTDKEIDIPASAQVVKYGETASYSEVWKSMKRDDTLKIAYSATGAIDYLVWGQSDIVYISNVVLLAIDEVDDDGQLGVLVSDGTGFYPVRTQASASLLGRRVNLSVDNRGMVIKFETQEQKSTSLTVSVVSSVGIGASNGGDTLIPGDTSVYSGGVSMSYSAAYGGMSEGDTLDIYYKRNGTMDYIIWTKSGATDTNTIHMSVIYPGGSSNTTLSIGGNSFTLTPEATLQAARFNRGERVSLVVSASGVVSAVYGGSWGSATGYMSADNTAILYNGLALTVKPASGTSLVRGMPVSVYGDDDGGITAYPLR